MSIRCEESKATTATCLANNVTVVNVVTVRQQVEVGILGAAVRALDVSATVAPIGSCNRCRLFSRAETVSNPASPPDDR